MTFRGLVTLLLWLIVTIVSCYGGFDNRSPSNFAIIEHIFANLHISLPVSFIIICVCEIIKWNSQTPKTTDNPRGSGEAAAIAPQTRPIPSSVAPSQVQVAGLFAARSDPNSLFNVRKAQREVLFHRANATQQAVELRAQHERERIARSIIAIQQAEREKTARAAAATQKVLELRAQHEREQAARLVMADQQAQQEKTARAAVLAQLALELRAQNEREQAVAA